ncbi:MAG TPA: efflux transporter outer membrane subunit [Xanthobacteraceae bacterium]|jgi:NodT family efflux transporter outer membrane factor (OMF) lipoprotein
MKTFKNSMIGVAAFLIGACSVGPDFQRPAPPISERITAGAQPSSTVEAPGAGGTAQHFREDAEVPTQWWTLFQCPTLDRLVQNALDNSPTIAQARAKLRQAQEDLNAQTGATRYPSLDAQLGVTHEKVDPAVFGIPNVPNVPPFTLYNAQVNVSYTLDFFGANRRALEALQAQAEYQNYEATAARLTLAANVVSAAIRQAALQAQIEITERLLQAQAQQLSIAEARYQVGGVALQDLHSQRSLLAQTRASLAPLLMQRQQVDHQLAVYIGESPGEASVPQFALDDIKLPTDLPLTLPSVLVQRRPDVRASEALWHQASAQVAVATANLFPQLTITGDAGTERTHASDIADGLNVWSIGARLMQPIFHGGELRAQKRSAQEAYAAAAAAYEQTVLESLQQVADSLRALEADAQTLQAQAEAAQQAESYYRIAQARYQSGGISEFSLLDAERQQLQSSLERTRAQANRDSDSVALLQSLGGGWK